MSRRHSLEASPPRRLFLKTTAAAVAGFSARLSRSAPVQAQSSQTVPPAAATSPVPGGWGPFTPSNHAGQYFRIEYPASTTEGALQIAVAYTLWIPDKVPTLRALIVHQHGAGIPAAQAGATSAYDLHWQALAKKWNCALLGPSYHVLNDAIDLTPGGSELWFDPRKGSDQVFLKALQELGDKSGHPELATVPWCLWGHSGGGIWSNVMSMLHPGRVLAVFLRSGTATMFRPRPEFHQPQVPAAVYQIPTMINFGMGEKGKRPWDGSLATFQEYRGQGAPIGFAPDPRTEHFCGDARYLAIPFFDACLAMRLAENGQPLRPVDMGQAWLAAPWSEVTAPLAKFRGDRKQAGWLPNEAVAQAWTEYVKTGTVSHSAAPPAPSNVRITARPDQSYEIAWEAEADFVVGLGGFVILRDGHGIARLPERPPDSVYGRPLFQGLSYHDTPFAPIPQMVYRDTSAQRGAKHVYTVFALSSAGVPSAASSPAAAGYAGASE